MQDIKYQVFISSTYSDLIEERRKILDTLLMADCIPAGMESFVAADISQFEIIKKVIDLCDYYILIIGQRYGSVNEETGLSYTEMEYNYAKQIGLPILVFAIDESAKLPIDKVEQVQENISKLKTFRNTALKSTLASIWANTEDLTQKFAISIMKAKSENKRPGWQRATSYDEASLRREIMELTEKSISLINELNEKRSYIESLNESRQINISEIFVEFKYSYTTNNRGVYSNHHNSRTFSLDQIFKVIATEMLDVMITESSIQNSIKRDLILNNSCSFDDNQIIKRILSTLTIQNLIYSNFDNNNKILFWGLTKLGQYKRNEMIILKVGVN